ncbi:MAG: DUF5684 domain-containing protein [Acidimicrobiales bacterium]
MRVLLFLIIYLAIIGAVIAGWWKIFEKAGRPGWAAIVPIYNVYVLTQIVGRPNWWVVLSLIPCVSIVAGVILCIDLAKSFGKSEGFGIGLALLPFVFGPMLGFGQDTYRGPSVVS